MANSDLMEIAGAGQLLARDGDTDYLAVHVVLAWPQGGVPALFCAHADWPHTTIARLAEKEREIAELASGLERYAAEATEQARRAEAAEARIKALEAQIAAPPPEMPRDNQAAQFKAQAAYLNDAPPEPLDEPIICPDCGKGGWKSAKALQMHRQRAHQGMVAVRVPVQFVEELGWRCAEPGCTGAFTRSLTEPDFCTLHAQRQSTNGVAHA